MDIKIALAGNPNCGKTTLFNALTGSNQYVGNWPGVTVEKKEGRLKGHKDVVIQDLPGIYSLSPYTLEEVVARSYLVGEKPDAILNIVDGTNVERNLYLTTQLIELGIPVVVAVNMIDLVRKNGDEIDRKKLGEALGCEVVEMSALKGEGGMAAAERAVSLARSRKAGELPHVFTGSVEHAVAHIEESIQGRVEERYLRWYAIKLFERDGRVLEELKLDAALAAHLEEHIKDCESELDDDAESIITNQRYAYISGVVERSVKKKAARHALSPSDQIDRVVTNRVLALPIFAGIMFLVYWVAMGPFGSFLTDWTNDVLGAEWLQAGSRALLEGWGCAEWLTGLVSDGIVAGVGAVLGFVPQMLVLFLMLAVLEDVGYMARVAFIMDRIFRKFGLSGKSFIPMLIGSGCGVPGVMASRTIENERDRRMTIMTTCFVPCGAKMPIIGLFAGALFGGSGLVAVSAYFPSSWSCPPTMSPPRATSCGRPGSAAGPLSSGPERSSWPPPSSSGSSRASALWTACSGWWRTTTPPCWLPSAARSASCSAPWALAIGSPPWPPSPASSPRRTWSPPSESCSRSGKKWPRTIRAC